MATKHMTPSLSRAARAILNWSMEDLAKLIGVGITTVRDYENGSRAPRKLTILAIAAAFHDEGIEFVGGEGHGAGQIDPVAVLAGARVGRVRGGRAGGGCRGRSTRRGARPR